MIVHYFYTEAQQNQPHDAITGEHNYLHYNSASDKEANQQSPVITDNPKNDLGVLDDASSLQSQTASINKGTETLFVVLVTWK